MKYQPPFDPNFAGPVDGIYNANPTEPYKNGNPATGEEGSIPPMESVAHPMTELVNLISSAGLTPSHADLEQVRKAVKKMIEDGTVSNSLTGGALAIWEGLEAGTKFHKIRPLKAGANVSLDLEEQPPGSGEYQIVISSAGGGGGGGGGGTTLTLQNIGTGRQVYKDTIGDVASLRSILGIDGITATQLANEITISGAGLLGFAPIYPETETADGKLTVTSSTGSVVVASGQTFIHRGARRIATTDYSTPSRTFATAASKIYHLRWRWNNGVPAFALLDLANGAYNPGALAETADAFDTKFDDMLIARVVTSAGNVPTVTTLINKDRHYLEDTLWWATADGPWQDDTPPEGWTTGIDVTVNFARRVQAGVVGYNDLSVPGNAEIAALAVGKSRYKLHAACSASSGPQGRWLRYFARM